METNNEVRLAACNALSIALTFASENFFQAARERLHHASDV